MNMKTNIFKVRDRDEKKRKIIIEEDRTKNPFLIFVKKYKMFFLLLIVTSIILSLLLSVGVAFSLFRGSNDYDISYIDGSDTINSNNDPTIKDDDIKKELLGDEARSVGVIVLTNTLMTDDGDVIDYYSDGTVIIVKSTGKIYRVFPTKNGSYGVDKNGKINEDCNKILVEADTSTLNDGSVITYYTDGTAKVYMNSKTIFVRDSNNVKTDGIISFINTFPSGVALPKLIQRKIVKYSDQTVFVVSDNKKYVVNKNTEVSVSEDKVNFDKNNAFVALGENTYIDGTTITLFANGSAIITDKKGGTIYVKKSGDILLKNKKLYEIVPNDYGYSISTINTNDGKKVTYFDNGAAIIIDENGERYYIEDNNDLVYDSKKNIVGNFEKIKKNGEKNTVDGEKVYNYSNGKSQVIRSDGTSYIVDTDKLKFGSSGTVVNNEDIENKPNYNIEEEDPGAGIVISEAENKYNDLKNIEDTVFTIQNKNSKNKTLRITIQEVENYSKYTKVGRLDPMYVKYQATVGNDFISPSYLTKNVWVDSNHKKNYVIYDGTIKAMDTVKVALSLYVDYSELDNSYQNTGFIGTIKIYVETKK